jgi:hypothetical protein
MFTSANQASKSERCLRSNSAASSAWGKRQLGRKWIFILFSAAAAVTLFPVNSPSAPDATHPEGVADLKWGVAPDDVKKSMLDRQGVVFSSETPELLTFTGGTFVNQTVKTWELHFHDAKLSGVVILINPDAPDAIYHSLCKSISEKYHKEGKEERAGATHKASYWHFSIANHRWVIVCDMSAVGIRISYYDEPPKANSPVDRRQL